MRLMDGGERMDPVNQLRLDSFFVIRRDDMPNQEPSRDKRFIPPSKPRDEPWHYYHGRETFNENHDKVLECMNHNRSRTMMEMASESLLSVRTVKRLMRELRGEGMVERDCHKHCEITGRLVPGYRLR